MAKLIYKRPGNIELIRRSDLARFLFPDIVESIEPSAITLKTSSLPDGNSDWGKKFSNGKEGKVTVNLSTFQPKLYSALTGATYTENSAFAIRHIVNMGIPATAPFTVDISAEHGTPAADPVPVVHDSNGSPFVKVSSVVAAGQFSVSGSVFTFSSANAGEEVVGAFDVSETSADKMEIPSETSIPEFEMIIAGHATLYESEGTTKADAWIFDTVTPSGDVKPPTRKKEPAGWSFTMELGKPRAGKKAVDYRVAR